MMGLSLGLSLGAGGKAAFSPATLPSLTAWYDPSDLSTLYQTEDTSTPVTASGQTVGRMEDKSGNGYHLLQATSGNRPTYTASGGLHWLAFDGVDKFMSAASVDFSASDEVMVGASCYTIDAGGLAALLELSAASSSNTGVFGIFDLGVSGAASVSWRSKGSTDGIVTATRGAALPVASAYVGQGKISTDTSTIRRNGTQIGTSAADQGTGNFSSNTLYVGMRAGTSLPYEGRVYGLIFASALPSAGHLASVETYLSGKAGI